MIEFSWRIRSEEPFRYDGSVDRKGARVQSIEREAGVVSYLVEATIGLPTMGAFMHFGKELEVSWCMEVCISKSVTYLQ